MAPGSQNGLQRVVEDVEALRQEFTSRGVEATEVQDFPWGSLIFFSDPDGNTWRCRRSRRAGKPERPGCGADGSVSP